MPKIQRRTRMGVGAGLAGVCVLGACGAAAMGQYDVAIVAASTNTANAQAEPRFTDVRNKLMATGLFDSVTIINATGIGDGVGTPPLVELMQYDAVITWSNVDYDDSATMGDVLADYVDAGKGVVVALYANTSTDPDRYLQGRWLSDPGYIAIPQNGGFVQGTPSGLGTVHVMGHPILDGVTNFFNNAPNLGSGPFGAWRPAQLSLTAGSTRIADWSTGQTLIALAPNAGVVELGFHPVSSAVNAGYWDQTTQGGLIMANALIFAADAVPDVPPACPGDITGPGGMPDGEVNVDDLNAILSAWGQNVGVGAPEDVANNDGLVDVDDLNVVLSNWQQPC